MSRPAKFKICEHILDEGTLGQSFKGKLKHEFKEQLAVLMANERNSDWERKARMDFRKEPFLRQTDLGNRSGQNQKSWAPVHTH